MFWFNGTTRAQVASPTHCVTFRALVQNCRQVFTGPFPHITVAVIVEVAGRAIDFQKNPPIRFV